MLTNAGNTAGSLISIYTGKYPSDTRVLFAPVILKDQDSKESLLSLLEQLDYSSTLFSYPYFADAYDLNLQSGFDNANGRSRNSTKLINFLNQYFDSNQSFFLYQISIRLSERISHIFYIQDMVDFSPLSQNNAQGFDDEDKFDTAIRIIKQTDNPVFIHIHSLETHGPKFTPKIQVYSKKDDIYLQQEYDINFFMTTASWILINMLDN